MEDLQNRNIVSRNEFNKQNNIFMDKLDDLTCKVNDILVKIAWIPERMSDKFDERYASKSVEEEVKTLKDESNKRTYEWLKYVVSLVVWICISYFIFNK